MAAKLFVSSDTADADLFLVLRLFGPTARRSRSVGSNDPRMPIGLGWLRASHRKLDPRRSLPYRPYHPHDEIWPLKPGEPVELDVEIWPTSIVVPPDYRLVLNVRGNDYRPWLRRQRLCHMPPTRCAVSATCFTTIRMIALPQSSVAATGCTLRREMSPTCCCRSSRLSP